MHAQSGVRDGLLHDFMTQFSNLRVVLRAYSSELSSITLLSMRWMADGLIVPACLDTLGQAGESVRRHQKASSCVKVEAKVECLPVKPSD